MLVRHHDLDFDLRQEIDHVLGAPVELGVPLLPAEALHLGDGQTGHADLRQRLAHLVELERLDDRFDFLHNTSPDFDVWSASNPYRGGDEGPRLPTATRAGGVSIVGKTREIKLHRRGALARGSRRHNGRSSPPSSITTMPMIEETRRISQVDPRMKQKITPVTGGAPD